VTYDNSLVVTVTVTSYAWAPTSGDHLFSCGAISRPPHPLFENPWLHLENFTIAPTWHTIFDSPWTIGEPQCFDQVRRNDAIDSLSIFGDLR